MIREEFDEPEWHPALIWLDATSRSRIDRTARPGWLGLNPAVDCDLWPEADLNAPRLLATVEGDYVAQTRVELGETHHTLAGLLLWRDEQHFARLELRRMFGKPATIYLEACVAGRVRHIGRGRVPAECSEIREAARGGAEGQPVWLRLERSGDEARGLCSTDGQRWLTCGTVRIPRAKAERVGIAAITREEGSHAWFDTFLLWSAEKGKG